MLCVLVGLFDVGLCLGWDLVLLLLVLVSVLCLLLNFLLLCFGDIVVCCGFGFVDLLF